MRQGKPDWIERLLIIASVLTTAALIILQSIELWGMLTD